MALLTTVSLTFIGLTLVTSNALTNIFKMESPVTPDSSPHFPAFPFPSDPTSGDGSVSESDARRSSSSPHSRESRGAAPRSGAEEEEEEEEEAQYGLPSYAHALRTPPQLPGRKGLRVLLPGEQAPPPLYDDVVPPGSSPQPARR
ncbi:hypothetical protein CALCODRAFT_518994 [Calocera cornea HHB12733]|uniref:Uncharacterized protein n=1 Tax=Calocera cornea HHB12733 TaxID=1353952 RepID=A0A165EK83_9BASI|nr:hypothetical protein CALCODRAFT_518994 [Calocera cornea HHB12733]